MPDTLLCHAQDCPNTHVPSSLTGEALLMDSGAIAPNEDTGRIDLKFGFDMSKKPPREAGTGGKSGAGDTVKTKGSTLTITGLLHHLWHTAGLDEWSPETDTRNWDFIREKLLKAAESMDVRKSPLAELIFMPESSQDDTYQLLKMASLSRVQENTQQIGILIGRGNKRTFSDAIEQNRLEIQNCRVRLAIDGKISKKLLIKYNEALDLWYNFDDTEMIVIATFRTIFDAGKYPSHFAIHELALMPATAIWIPYTKPYQLEKILIEKLSSEKRLFTKCLDYNLSFAKPFPSVVLRDAIAPEIDLFVCPEEAVSTMGSPFQDILDKKPETTWCWFAESSPNMLAEMPPIPQKQAQRKGK